MLQSEKTLLGTRAAANVVAASHLSLVQILEMEDDSAKSEAIDLSPFQVDAVGDLRFEAVRIWTKFFGSPEPQTLEAAAEVEDLLIAGSDLEPSLLAARKMDGGVRLLRDRKDSAMEIAEQFPDHHISRGLHFVNDLDVLELLQRLEAPAHEMRRTVEALERVPALQVDRDPTLFEFDSHSGFIF